MKTLEQVIEETEWLDQVCKILGTYDIDEKKYLKFKSKGLTPEQAAIK